MIKWRRYAYILHAPKWRHARIWPPLYHLIQHLIRWLVVWERFALAELVMSWPIGMCQMKNLYLTIATSCLNMWMLLRKLCANFVSGIPGQPTEISLLIWLQPNFMDLSRLSGEDHCVQNLELLWYTLLLWGTQFISVTYLSLRYLGIDWTQDHLLLMNRDPELQYVTPPFWRD